MDLGSIVKRTPHAKNAKRRRDLEIAGLQHTVSSIGGIHILVMFAVDDCNMWRY